MVHGQYKVHKGRLLGYRHYKVQTVTMLIDKPTPVIWGSYGVVSRL